MLASETRGHDLICKAAAVDHNISTLQPSLTSLVLLPILNFLIDTRAIIRIICYNLCRRLLLPQKTYHKTVGCFNYYFLIIIP